MSGLSTPTPISVLFAGRMRLLHVVDIHKHSLLVDCLLVTALLGCVIAKLMHLSRRGTGKGRPSIPHISGIPFVGSLAFFTRRHRFILDCMTRHGPMFSFNVASVSALVKLMMKYALKYPLHSIRSLSSPGRGQGSSSSALATSVSVKATEYCLEMYVRGLPSHRLRELTRTRFLPFRAFMYKKRKTDPVVYDVVFELPGLCFVNPFSHL